jgi:pilus assembly protein CpaF
MAQSPVKKEDVEKWKTFCGPLEALLQDSSITEIMVNGHKQVFIEQKGILKKTPVQFRSDSELLALMQIFANYVNRPLDADNPCVDARLPDGSRVNCVVPPASVDGPALTIRKFSPFYSDAKQLVASGTIDDRVGYFLSCLVSARINTLVVGGTGSGKTTLLNVLASFIPPHERIVTIEDAAELKIRNPNLVRLETRPPSKEDEGITTEMLVKNALRMRPDRIIVGECRGREAWDMLVAMNTGHEGSMTTLHANSAREALRRLEGMVLMSTEMPMRAIREHMAAAIDCIVSIQRMADGSRKVKEIIEVSGMEGDVILTQDIFKYNPADGFKNMGFVPKFVSRFAERGVKFPMDFFTDRYK